MISRTTRTLGLMSLVMITIGAVDSIRNLPATALFGSNIIAFFILAAIFFLIPSGMISAELASQAAEGEGGIYRWVTQAFGKKAGFIAVWFQWIENVVYYPALLSFIAGTVAYLIDPHLIQDKIYLVSFILIAFWVITGLNMLGMKTSSFISNICALFGLVLPMFLIIAMGIIWVASGKPMHVNLTPSHLMPDFSHPELWVTLAGVMLSMCGMEIATIHVRETKNPQRTFPRALLISTVFILVTLILGALSIAIVVPKSQLSLIAGILQAFQLFFDAYHLHWMVPVVAISLIIGGMGGLNSWLIAPTRGLQYAGKQGHHLPKLLLHENRHGAPVALLITQAIIVSITLVIFVLLPTINSSYWYLNVLAAQLYMFMYILMFAASIALRKRRGQHHKIGYQIPGGPMGTYVVAALGLVGSIATVIIGFFPPSNIHDGSVGHYAFLIAIGLLVMSAPAVWLSWRGK